MFMERLNFTQLRIDLIKNLKQLPPTELHYYFALLLASIEREPNPEQHIDLIIKTNEALIGLNQYFKEKEELREAELVQVIAAINALVKASKLNTTPQQIKKAILALCSVACGVVFGIVGAVSGALGGLLSDYTIVGNIRALGLGFLPGLAIGAFVGSRLPYKVSQSNFISELDFCMKGIIKVSKELPSKKTYAEYEQETKNYILRQFFAATPEAERDDAFQHFLESSNQQFTVCTTTAGFISPVYKGYVGHHNLIKFSINDVTHTPMEYGDRLKTPNFCDQNESPRTVTGKKLFDMLVLDHILQETNAYTVPNYIRNFQMGSDDCQTYINKLLMGTGQAPTQIPRFNSKIDKEVGTRVIGPLIRFFTPVRDTTVYQLVKDYKASPDAPDPELYARRWTGKNTSVPAEEPSVGFVP